MQASAKVFEKESIDENIVPRIENCDHMKLKIVCTAKETVSRISHESQ